MPVARPDVGPPVSASSLVQLLAALREHYHALGLTFTTSDLRKQNNYLAVSKAISSKTKGAAAGILIRIPFALPADHMCPLASNYYCCYLIVVL